MSQVVPPSSSESPQPPAGPPHHETIMAGVRWSSVFEFTYLFRGFRLAMNPTKLILALLAIIMIYTAGRAFDGVWGPRVYEDELDSYQTLPAAQYRQQRDDKKEEQRNKLEELLNAADSAGLTADQITSLRDRPAAAQRVLRRAFIDKFHKNIIDETPQQRADDAEQLRTQVAALQDTVGHGIFDSLMNYEIKQFDALIDNTLTFVRISPMHGPANAGADDSQAVSGGLFSKNPERLWRSDTVLGCIANMTITAPVWLVTGTEPMQWHPVAVDVGTWKGWFEVWFLHRLPYLVSLFILLAFWLVVIAISGAMICRISALEFAGREEVPLPQIWQFARKKLVAYIAAPLMPLAIIVVLGGLLSLMSLVGAVPYIGEVLLGMAFIFFLAAGFVMMLVLLGALGGFNLMYPTMSVEGSDAFDACSRSWAYVYGAPWRLILYTVISLVYGIITLLFVSFCAYLVLALTHAFVGYGADAFGLAHGHFNGLPKLDTLWPMPHLDALSQPTNWAAMNWSEWLGSMFLHFWVFIVIAFVGAYVMSFHYSIHTILYFLLRRAVEGQSLSEVYQEEDAAPETPAPAAVAANAVEAAPAAAATIVEPTPAAVEPPPAAPATESTDQPEAPPTSA